MATDSSQFRPETLVGFIPASVCIEIFLSNDLYDRQRPLRSCILILCSEAIKIVS
jgi:hypothetical protein